VISLLTGIAMLFFYTPSPERGPAGLAYLSSLPLGNLLRAVHRSAADILVLIIVLHIVRTWAGERFRGPRSRNWVKGLLALPLLGLIGWSGYILPWDERAMVLASWGRELLVSIDRWPVISALHIGSLISAPIFSAGNETDLLLRIFAVHIGGAMLAILLAIWHLKRVTPPRVILPIRAWVVLAILLVLVAQMTPFHHADVKPFNPFAPPGIVHVDFLITFPLLFYPMLGAPLLSAVIAIVWLALALLPRLEPRKPLVACVDEVLCDGCRLCAQDCPYGAIIMVSRSAEEHCEEICEVARILPAYCNACGVCVGSCEPDAIELPDLRSADVVGKIDAILVNISRNHQTGQGGLE
jgi:ferredoxin